jgi:hypothetical protein
MNVKDFLPSKVMTARRYSGSLAWVLIGVRGAPVADSYSGTVAELAGPGCDRPEEVRKDANLAEEGFPVSVDDLPT